MMPAERVNMRRVREILRYRSEQGLGHKAISYRVGAAPSTVRETLRRTEAAGLTWPLGEEVSDAVLEAALYRAAGTKTGHRRCPEPEWARIHRELKRKHVTLQIVWDELYYHASRRVSLQPFLRSLSWLGGEAAGDDAADPRRWRQAVRRLCGRQGRGGRRPADRRDARRAHLRGGARRIKPVLCRGELDRAAARLARAARAAARGIR